MMISEYHAYKTIWTLFIIKLNLLSAASSYQEWFQVKAWAFNKAGVYFIQCQNTQLIIETGVYSEEAFI